VWLLVCSPALAQPAGSETCAGCHGARGEGNPAMGSPRIAGQPAAYLFRQLEAYTDGSRQNEVMAPIAKGLTPSQQRELAAHYANLVAPATKTGAASAPPRGRTLATVGDEQRRVQACQNCHGPEGAGLPPLVPYLAGLDNKYLQAELHDWKNGTRKTDPSGAMNLIAQHMTDPDMAAVSAYYASRPPPVPQPKEKLAQKKSKAPTRAGSGTKPIEGVGVGGDAATTGGSQGPGGASGGGPSGTKP
jgi:cytochrome c553